MRILFCGQSGYPSNYNATMNRYGSIAKAMSFNNEIIFINRFSFYNVNDYPKNKADFKTIEVSGEKYKSKNFIKRNLLKLLAPLFEFSTIYKLHKKKKIDYVNVYTQFFGLCVFYFLLSKIFRFKTIFHFVEKRSEFKRRSFLYNINDYLYERYIMFLFDRYIPISNYLDNHLKARKPQVKTIIIPPICDFEYFNNIKNLEINNDKYFLFCGSSRYSETIIFIIESFKKLKTDKSVKLYLVINGELTEELRNSISDNRIKVFSRLEYDTLILFYKNALALLIPIRNTIQDKARFPHKICEYIASKNLIVTTNYGEVQYYFKDNDNALVAKNYEIESYSKKMQYAISNNTDLNNIKNNAYQIGKLKFDIKAYSETLNIFLKC